MGLETSSLRVTHDAVITSLIRYGLLILGSCLPEDLIDKMDVQIINTAARRASDPPRTVRIESLQFLSGTRTYRNLYIKHCAQQVHSSLACGGSLTHARIRKEICSMCAIPSLDLDSGELHFDPLGAFWREDGSLPCQLIGHIR